MRGFALVLAVTLGACGDGGTSDAGPGDAQTLDAPSGGSLDAPPSASMGTIVLGGSLSGTMAAAVNAGQADGESISLVGITAQPLPAGYKAVNALLMIADAPMVKDYPAAALMGAVTVTTSDDKTWTAVPGQPVGTVGALHVTSVSVFMHTGNTTVFTLHGSFDATLAPQQQGGTNVIFTATF
jgi:hypothetical protein